VTEVGSEQLPFVSVVVTSDDPGGGLAACLASFEGLEYPHDRYELIVVGDGSSRATAERLGARHVVQARKGVGCARNAGIAASRGEIVAFTDPDCAVSTVWLRELVAPFADEGVGAVAGAILPYPPASEAERYAARRLSHNQLRPLRHPDRPFALTPNLAVRHAVFSRIGAFDESFPGGGWEDADLCWRLTGAGLSLEYAPRAVVFHRYRATAMAFLVQHYRYGYGLGLLLRKYRHELPPSWLAGPEAHHRLARYAVRWARTAALSRIGEPRDASATKFDFLRVLGQRAGMLRAAAAGPAGRGRRR
jgi:GT2 family glycosyltransferase